jgi:hypothetical protein
MSNGPDLCKHSLCRAEIHNLFTGWLYLPASFPGTPRLWGKQGPVNPRKAEQGPAPLRILEDRL